MRKILNFLYILVFSIVFLSGLSASELVFIDVGQGNATIVKFKDASPLVVDSGSSELRGKTLAEKREFKLKVISEIRSKIECSLLAYKKTVDTKDLNVVVSHAHTDHYNLIRPIFDNDWMKSKKIRFLLGGKKEDYSSKKESQKLLEIIAQYQEKETFVRDFKDEDSITDFEYPVGYFKILIAPHFDGDDLNERSIVLRIKIGNIGCVLSGDATSKVTDHILTKYSGEKGKELESDIYQACHHGSDTCGSNDEKFISAIKPKWVIFSSGQKHNHPSSKVLGRVFSYLISDPRNCYHVLRYHCDGGDSSDIIDKTNINRFIKKIKDLHSGYVFSVTNLGVFNTQDQRSITFRVTDSVLDTVSHGGKTKCNLDFSDSDLEV